MWQTLESTPQRAFHSHTVMRIPTQCSWERPVKLAQMQMFLLDTVRFLVSDVNLVCRLQIQAFEETLL